MNNPISQRNKDSEVYVINNDEIKKHLRVELGIFGSSLKKLLESFKLNDKNIPDSVKLSNLETVESSLEGIKAVIEALDNRVSKLDFQPQINVNIPDVVVPEIKHPNIYVPEIKAPNVTVNPIVDIDLEAVLTALKPLSNLSNSPKKPISVRLSDGKEFLEQLTQAVSRGNEQLATVVSTSYGLTKDEFKAAQVEQETVLRNGMSLPYHNEQVIDEADPDNVTITYKLNGTTVATKTIAVVGTTTTITLS